MDETEELIQLSARALVSQMNAAPGFELHMTRDCVLGLADEPLAETSTTVLDTERVGRGQEPSGRAEPPLMHRRVQKRIVFRMRRQAREGATAPQTKTRRICTIIAAHLL